jgi:hypothetical protein
MKTTQSTQVEVQAQSDHLDSLAKGKPLFALAELIWNAFDADAHEVRVTVKDNALGGVDEIAIQDDGHGLTHSEAETAFGHLGGSWKKKAGRTIGEKRVLHGKEGKGRFKAFALGNEVTWTTVFQANGGPEEFRILGNRSNLKKFTIEAPTVLESGRTGTIVTISQISEPLGVLAEEGSASERLTEFFALYLRDYPSARLFYRGREIIPTSVQKDFREYLLNDIDLGNGEKASAVLQIVEWHSKRDRKICLCNEGGFTLHEIDAAIRPGAEFQFTAYLRSPVIAELHRENRLELEDLEPSLKALVDAAREQMRAHFREKRASAGADLVREWKEEGIYPYAGDSEDPIELARRQVFEICALNVHEYLADFRRSDTKSRKFTFRMLREALEDSPASLQRILQDVLELPKDKREELAELLDRTTLSAIIEASSLITNRLAFLKGLEELLFNKESKKELDERSQLHKILEKETWIFGEEFHLTASDETLTTVLAKYLSKLRPGEKVEKVIRDDGRQAVIDLLLAREIPQNYKHRREFLVVELKRPSQKVDLDVKGQIESYALAVVEDERFDITNTFWTFIAVSNELSPQAQKTVNQPQLPRGYFHVADNFRVGLMTWAEVLMHCRTRLELFRAKLGYTATTDDGVALLKERYAKYLPSVMLKAAAPSPEMSDGSS